MNDEPAGELRRAELAAIGSLQVVSQVLMVMAGLWNGQHSGRFDEAMITRHLDKARS
jgi:hypothetical protein